MQRKTVSLFIFLMLLIAVGASAQEIRYVSKQGAYANDGKSWATAKYNIQDAINDLVDNGLTGEVWVAAGTYTPTESTESSGGSTLYMSFKIPAGISVYGGFEGTETSKDQRAMNSTRSIGSIYKNSTILSGDLSSSAKFTWNKTKEQWDASFYGNCYHVVFFATNGFDASGRAKPNGGGYRSALLEGCIIEHGNAYNSDIAGRPHNAYGGGVYMVAGAHLQNCLVRQCVAYRDGGGIYMDGGGYVEHCGVTDCQTLGIGTTYGYGGGVCMDGPDTYDAKTTNPMILRRSGIFGCVARMGGGVSIAVNDTTGNNKYQLACTSVVVANNTASNEAGGVYMNRGGAITQMTVVNNKCNGAGVITNGMSNGRAAGIYCRDNAIIANSVMWGGVCKANNNIQFATSRSGNSTSLNPQMFYSSLTHSDYTDWSGVTKREVVKLSEYNTHDDGTANASEGYPMFYHPTPNAGYVSSQQGLQFLYGGTSSIADGVTLYDASGNKVEAANIQLGTTYYIDANQKTVAVEGTHYTYLGAAYDFQPESRSSINHKGIITADLDRYGQTPAFEVDLDVMGRRFTPRPTNGAYTSSTTTIEPQQTTDADDNTVYNFYVDPQDDRGTEYNSIGSSWDQPVRFLADALNYISSQNYLTTATVNVYVKQGTVNNTTTSVVGRIRTTTIDIPSNVHLYGGYSSENTGTSLKVRNPNVYVTTISAEAQGIYELNVAHLLIFNGTKNTMLDGFSIRRANARSTEMIEGTPVTTGAAMTFTNASEVVIRNCGVANNTASQGAVADLVSSEVHFENCIFHNNESRVLNDDGTTKSITGNILVGSGSQAVFSHCNFIRNVGYAIDTYGKVTTVNSMFYGNMQEPLEDTRNNEAKALAAVRLLSSGSTKGTFTGDHNLYDTKSSGFINDNSLDATNEAILTYTFSDTSTTYPRFINPTKNAGVSTSGDVTYYGRTISFQPHNNNPMVNRASKVDYQGNATDDHNKWGTDMTGIITRDYGGLPDIGAVENHESTVADEGEKAYPNGQRPYGGALYVRDYRDSDGSIDTSIDGRDGSSWENAINGNGTYSSTSSTVTGGKATTPTTSTIDNPVTYKLRRCSDSYYAKNSDGTYLNGTSDYFSGDDFIFISGTGGYYYIYDVTQSKYVIHTSTTNSSTGVQFSDDNTTNALWRLKQNGTSKQYWIQPSTTTDANGSPSWNLWGGSSGNVGLYGSDGTDSQWQVMEPATSQTTVSVKGFQHAINTANTQWYEDHGTLKEVRVGAGTYTANLEWKEGVNVRGGYPAVGNPGDDERNISNAKDGYQTIIDANASGRVLLQPANFTQQTLFEGFTIQNGSLSGDAYGAGVYLRSNGVLKNCLVQNNKFTANKSTGANYGGAGVFLNDGSIVKNCKIMKNTLTSAVSGKLVGGAGVYAAGGTLINSLIVENTAYNSAWNILGAGFYIRSNSSIYNCTIAYNVAYETGTTKYPATGGVWDASGSSSFYNSIIWGNYATGSTGENMVQVGISGYTTGGGVNKNLYSCYSSAWSTRWSSDDVNNSDLVNVVGDGTTGDQNSYSAFFTNCKEKEPFVRDAVGNTDYSLKAAATQCINKGSDFDALDTYDITVDINGEDRIQDCTIDKGAYEYNQSLDISPEITTATTGATNRKLVFYVTPNGHGTASANSPTNAACASKLQKVLDAAGRYKYNNPADTVIVKVANSNTLQEDGEHFQYYACRTTDEGDQSVRVWSIIVPRGVEVWGGYTDTYKDADTNGFYTKASDGTITDNRDITGNPTYFDSYYYNKSEKQNAYTYHVVTFTDRVFDGEGKPYVTGNTVGKTSSWTEGNTNYLSMAEKTTDRAVIDGLYITGGNADAQVTSLANTNVNINQYGGAAIVTDYAHVRNCIVRGNSATYGGALALTHNALVSGCLIDQNTADYGGAIYMFENGTQLSDGTVINTTPSGTQLDEKMAHVYTSTIVNNTANTQGGGIWFGQDEENINIRVNSTVVWQNSSASQANISGLFNPTKAPGNTATTIEFYPFSYCAAQNLRLSGTNNIQLGNLNSAGVRFADKDAKDQQTLAKETTATDFTRFSNFGYYGLTDYSVLVRTGMPVNEYTALVKSAGLSAADFMKKDRLVTTSNNRSYIEIGARALDKVVRNGQLMLRLFVAKPEDVDMDAAQTMMSLANTATSGSVEEYYSQEGSSFAYPMQSLQDAIDYIIEKRSYNDTKAALNQPGANNLPFEIFIAQGTYYPTRNLAGVYGNSPGNSFLLPEGVSVYGSFNAGNPDDSKSFFGRYFTANSNPENYGNDLSKNVTAVTDTEVTLSGTYKIEQKPISDIYQRRRSNDNNGNNIIEPWEFANQTILSGDVENSQHNGVYHVIQVLADQNVVGMLPKASESHETASDIYHSQSYADYIAANGPGSFDFEEGQYIILDGVQVTGGMGMNYQEGSTTYLSKYNYYRGGGLLIDGNRYCDDYNKGTSEGTVYKHNGVAGAVGYRDIPIVVAHCKFIDNTAGVGGALCSNGTVNLYENAFEQNRAQSGTDQVNDSDGNQVFVNYAGVGGAVMATHQFSAYNTLFANNEAYDKALNVTGKIFTNLNVQDDDLNTRLGGVGGVVYMGPFGYFHIVNCDLVRNQANAYPAVFTMNPNKDYTGTRNGGIGSSNVNHPSTVYYNQMVNTVIWGNDINEEMSKKYDSDSTYPLFKFNSRLICNYAPGEYTSYGVPDFTSGSKNSPASQEALDKGSDAKESDFGETAWFSAYEEGRGITPLNDSDFRASTYNPFKYVRDLIHEAGTAFTPSVDTYQNSNIQLSSENLELEGPNFINPSTTPGYAGYNESADWSPARINNLVDNGSGQISQTITLEGESYKSSFNTYTSDNLPTRSIYKSGASGYTSENAGDYVTEGAYTTTRVLYGYDNNRLYMPEGEMFYMRSAATGQELYRISYDPNPTHNQTYIDIGVYEYPHTELQYTTDGDEVDILWVSPSEKPDNGLPDGSAWSQPTSDLQRAIETLLASRNGHRKEIRLMNGSYTPIYSINDKLAFTIDTKSLNQSVVLPVRSTSDGNVEYVTGKGVVSLTIKGGYSEELNNVYDPEQYPAVMRQQARTNESSDRWDNLLYISDPTQRYGYDPTVGYTGTNGYGNYAPNDAGTGYNPVVNTIPIHIDGVTMVNNQALAGKNGAAIHYSDVAEGVTSPTAAHVALNQYYSDTDTTQVSPDNEPTLHFNRQVDKYYTDATYTTESETPTAYVKYKYIETAANKIIISKSKIMNSGSWKYTTGDYSTSAVYIGKNGGNALLYNDVMHSNWGNPLVSAVYTTIVNNTYALNKGRVDLNGENTRVSTLDINKSDNSEDVDDDGPLLAPHRPRRASDDSSSASSPSPATTSAIFNSVFWRNNDDGTQFVLPGWISATKSGAIFSHNAVTGFKTDVTDYSLEDIPNENYNVGLSDENSDVINGPNFTDPKVAATTSTDIEARDFTLQPSLRLLNKGSDDLYEDNVTKNPTTYNIYDLAWVTTTRMDAGGEQRFCYDIDLGAYEYQNNLNRIIYVNPNINVTGLGNTWADPVAYGNLQAAIDLASVYHVNNTGEEAYVFVKGAGSNNTGLHLGETITMRNGVSIYGSILPTRTVDCPYTTHDVNGSTVRTYNQDDIDAYINTLTAERSGVASPSANRTTVSGIKVPASTTFTDNNDNIVALVDGFDVTATNSGNPTGVVTEPVIDVEPLNSGGHVALRNIIVHDNDASATALTNIANINNALIYEALFRDNKVSTSGCQLRIMPNGYGVNLTVEGTTVGADGKSTYNGAGDTDHIYNSLVNYAGQAATENTLSGYNYKVADKNLNYQLTEQSQHIDQCAATNPIASVASLAQFVNYDTDRDLLGNLRLLSGVSSANKIDRGAFETWRVDQDVECTSTDADGNLTSYYPHPGSVVYIMKGKNLVMEQYAATTDENGVVTQTSGTVLRPAYLLVQEGASLYGNGNNVNVGYVGLERTVSNKGSMVSVPYAMNYLGSTPATNGVGIPTYATTGVLTLGSATAAEAYSYNGVGRSAWNSTFYDTQSAYWTSLFDKATDANTGVLYKPATSSTYRFTAQGDADDMTKYVYTEAVDEISKTVTLTQHDDRTSTNGAADFTEKEDMGWNCIGLPWLVSNYDTSAKETLSTESHYNMDIPHTLWLWYDGKTYPDGTTAADGDGGYYSVSSWDTTDWHLATDATARIWTGEGIFTQTAAVSDTEDLMFYRPVYTATTITPSGAKKMDLGEKASTRSFNARYYVTERGIDDAKSDISIEVRGRIVYVSGLQGGESITLYDASGRIYNMATASSDTYSTAVPTSGIYIIRVDNKTQTFAVK